MHGDLQAALRVDPDLKRCLDDFYNLCGLAGLSLVELLI